jgi:hypothetical protein
MKRAAVFAAIAVLTLAGAADAQTLREQCTPQVWPEYCQRLADAAASIAPRMAMIAAGGNPIAGTASTLGMRLPGSPRVSFALRATAGRVRMPRVTESDATGETTTTAIGTALDAGVGLFHGINIGPTVGGFGAVDVIASAGLLHEGDDELDAGGFTWGAGVRIGILRESFTAPGISVSAVYRGLPDVAYVLDHEVLSMQLFEAENNSAWSVRGTVGKRLLGVGLTGGVGYDRTSSDLAVSYMAPGPGTGILVQLDESGVSDSRMSYFANLSHTTTILNLVLELGWQQNGDRASGAHRSTRRGGLFGGAAVRLAI